MHVALDVHGLPARAHAVGLLHDGDAGAVAVEPERDGGARDAGAGDEDVEV